MSEVLRCEHVTKRYGTTVALDDVSLVLESGKIIGLLGPNGSGKTTMIKLINGLLTPEEGVLTVCGFVPGPESKTKVAYLPDNLYLSTWMTAKQIVAYFTDFYEDFRPELALEMMERLGISPNCRLQTLSKGNKEKVCLILTMSRNAKLYVLDEPIAGVDPAARDYILSTIVSNYNPSASIIITTHLITDIEQVLDDFVFLSYGGNVLYAGSAENTRNETGKSLDELFREVFKC